MQAAVDAGDLVVPVPDEVRLERPKVKDHGDYATSVALQLAKPAGQAPRQVAEVIAGQLRGSAGVATVDIAGPGFLNITLDAAAQGELARTVVTAGAGYGGGTTSSGHRYNLEFVSANPTGPLHLGHVRWAAVGDALARILQFIGAEVAREYYFNDAGVQIDRFAGSLLAAAKGEPTPQDGYGGRFIGLANIFNIEAPVRVPGQPANVGSVFGTYSFRRDAGVTLGTTAVSAAWNFESCSQTSSAIIAARVASITRSEDSSSARLRPSTYCIATKK